MAKIDNFTGDSYHAPGQVYE